MAASLLRFLPRRWLTRLGWLCLALMGLGLVCNYTYLRIRHDMALITAKQPNLFEVFYQRARILAPEKLADFIDNSSIKMPIFSDNGDAAAYAYGYDLPTLKRLAVIPVLPPANQMLLVAVAWQMYDLTGSAWDLGLVGLFQFAPALLAVLPAGHCVDRGHRGRIFAMVMFGQVVVALALAAASWHAMVTRELILGLSVLLGLARAFQMPAQQALTPLLVPAALLPRAVALASSGVQASIIGGPALGGLLITTVGYGWAFVVDGLSYVAVLIALGLMRVAELRPSEVAARGKGQVREGLRYVRTVPALFIPLVMMGVVGALAFKAAHAIRNFYLKKPGEMIA